MQFNNDTIDNAFDEREMEEAWRKQIEKSEAWKRHKEQHRDAELVTAESSPLEEEKKHDNPVVKYDAETGHYPSMTCNCGQHFELHEDTHRVYMSGSDSFGQSQETQSPYLERKGTGDIYRRDPAPSRFFSYKN